MSPEKKLSVLSLVDLRGGGGGTREVVELLFFTLTERWGRWFLVFLISGPIPLRLFWFQLNYLSFGVHVNPPSGPGYEDLKKRQIRSYQYFWKSVQQQQWTKSTIMLDACLTSPSVVLWTHPLSLIPAACLLVILLVADR